MEHCDTQEEEEVEGNSEERQVGQGLGEQRPADSGETSHGIIDTHNNENEHETKKSVADDIKLESTDGSITKSGRPEVTFHVQRAVLRQTSAFFRAATKAR
jgi:hypothetical protein